MLVRVKPALLLAATVAVACRSATRCPVQPVTVKVCPLPVAVRLAVVMPLKASDMPSVDDSDVLVKRVAGALARRHGVRAVPVSDPLPVQPLTVKVLPLPVSVRLAVVIPLKAQRQCRR